jgi:hypothetical protein
LSKLLNHHTFLALCRAFCKEIGQDFRPI